jgi:glutamine cyclotransferase
MQPLKMRYRVVHTIENVSPAFIQGFEYHAEGFLVSAGHFGASAIQIRDARGTILQQRKLTGDYFAEGCTRLNGKIYQLTWREKVCFVYDESLNPIQTCSYNGEGWGLTNDGQFLIMSDGSGTLTFRDPHDFRVIKSISTGYTRLNALAFIDGAIFANVWLTSIILCIDPLTGGIMFYLDLTGIYPGGTGENVLNGIAYDRENRRIFVTGKNWTKIFQIAVLPVLPVQPVLPLTAPLLMSFKSGQNLVLPRRRINHRW